MNAFQSSSVDVRRPSHLLIGLLATTAIACVLPPAQASAQSVPPAKAAKAATNPDNAEEVIVTARRRDEALKDVPIALTAFSAAKLELSGIQDISQLQKSTPNLTMQVARGSNSTITAFIRGIGQQDPLWGFEPGVGLYVDDVYIARPQGALLDVYNVDRIEVLRGPQGSLYGRNTIGGAVKYVTAPMKLDPTFSLKVQTGSYNERDVTVSGSYPITSALRVGGAFTRLSHDGYGRNLLTGDQNYNKDLIAGRGSVEFEPNQQFFFRLTADKYIDDSKARVGHREIPGDLGDAPVTSNDYDTYSGMPNKNRVANHGYSLLARYSPNSEWTFKSISAFRKGNTITNIDFAGVPKPELQVPGFYYDSQFSQEVQALYEGPKLKGVFGVFYLDATAGGSADTILGNANLTLNFSGKSLTKSTAVFGDASYDISDRLQVSLGGRYTEDARTGTVYRVLALGLGTAALGGKGIPFQVRTDYTNKKNFSQFTPRGSISYKLDSYLTTYVTVSQGFKSGGFDMRGDAFLTPNTRDGYGPEKVTSYEAGLKGTAFDQRVNFNAAVFYADYSDLQVTIQTAATPPAVGIASIVANAAKARIQGAELEARAQVYGPLSANMSLGLADAKIDQTPVTIANGILVFQNTPKWTGSFQLVYAVPGTVLGGSLSINGGASYRSMTYQFNAPIPALDQKAYTLFDANLAWTSGSGNWRAILSGLNLTDERYKIAGYNFPGITFGNTLAAFYGDPRTAKISMQYSF